MEVGAEPGSETQGWVRDWDPNSPCPEQDSWLGVLDFFTSPAVRAVLYSTAGGSARGSQPRSSSTSSNSETRSEHGAPSLPHISTNSQGQEFNIKILRDVGVWWGRMPRSSGDPSGPQPGRHSLYQRDRGQEEGWTRTQSWERAKGNSPSDQHFIAWDGVSRPKFCLLTLHIPQPASPCTTRS